MTNVWKSYDGFHEDVAAAQAAKKAIDEYAAAQTDGAALCPRCGRVSMNERLHSNALSRYSNAYVCDECGMDEALRDWKGIPIPLWDWAIAKQETAS